MTVKDLLNHLTQVPRNNCKGIGRFYHQSMMKLPEFIEELMSIHNSFVQFLQVIRRIQFKLLVRDCKCCDRF